MSIQKTIYCILEEPEKSSVSYWFNTAIYLLIMVSIISLMLSTVDELNNQYAFVFSAINNIIMPIFVIEYIARVYASGHLREYEGFLGKLRYIITPYAIIDLLSIAPYILVGFDINSSFIRSLRLIRVFRLFRMKKYAIFAKVMQQIFAGKKEEFLVLIFYAIVIIIMLSFIVFELEHDAQPDVFSNVPQTLWWSVATLTTVGYGDMYPITTIGKFITAIISILGIAFIAIPGGMFASEFINIFARNKERDELTDSCYRCGALNVSSSDKPKISYENKNVLFDKLYTCQECKFTWVDDEEKL